MTKGVDQSATKDYAVYKHIPEPGRPQLDQALVGTHQVRTLIQMTPLWQLQEDLSTRYKIIVKTFGPPDVSCTSVSELQINIIGVNAHHGNISTDTLTWRCNISHTRPYDVNSYAGQLSMEAIDPYAMHLNQSNLMYISRVVMKCEWQHITNPHLEHHLL